ncbi:MAG: 16S rRNA (guanine(966)-N(2))-methyltransferase RsmD [Prochlorothrix sp.]|nr:16S rRNA (guanine(966)-N(2))-methyltransferase RsmD [Prochlorothrix sp.]
MTLRIIGNRTLKTLPGETTRPTAARVREALFNIWQGDVEGCRWLDLCAGSGAMGAEALGRGAAAVVGVEQWGKACGVIAENWRKVAQPGQEFRVIRGTVPGVLGKLAGEGFDRIYFDPPYASDCYEPTLAAIVQYQLLRGEGVLAVEQDRGRSMDEVPGLVLLRVKNYGKTAIAFYCATDPRVGGE